ncbi:MAG: leucine--tRNA ligase [Bdellovibrionales bacterium RIFCSPHIGHO2_01_FULL_40_29]|nr:MAG: leucine--tRNA ligase [Bdellovibrionales bacterium RIFCSPHIGHO2_01_FULL_40_29]OFZ35124.1 MAG: leucine--tRNA ligase [Bdellovibrionales bacterium RIFCSPHIGHO2_02_FULL_40_15]
MKHIEIQEKWQNIWDKQQAYKTETDSKKPKYYALDMFPYPSGSGLHMGHIASYTPGDIVSRYKRARGFNVLHPMGYDAFGLPAEQFAIQTGVHPAITTEKSIAGFRSTLKKYGFSFDWSREISTADPSYYKWTQAIFIKLFEKGLAYQKEVPVNWCPALKTVLANDEVIDGKSERGGHPVIRVPMKQWMLKITDYAERLLNDLDKLDWPERTKEGQRNWIGKSEGASVFFSVKGQNEKLEVFTTRPDTLFGVSFMVLAPEHPLVKKLTSADQATSVSSYIETTAKKSEVDRKATTEKTGVFTGGYAINPLNKKEIPVWIADYVMMDYGTGAIMAVPGHDERDFEFAQKFSLPILRVLESESDLPFTGEGKLINSDFLNGLLKSEAVTKMIAYLESENLGKKQINYKLRDWLFSRQRYWGEPFPIVQTPDGTLKAVPLNELPVVLPEVANYEPSESGEAPLAKNTEWVNYNSHGLTGKRITDTMPGAAGSSWYFFRYADPHNDKEAFSQQAAKYWMPVDLYVGGPEHTVGHLLYSRFWTKVLFDAGISPVDEPFKKLAHQGMILGPDGEKMSKSRGNVIPADEVAGEYGVDALRCFVCFLGPMDKDKPWSSSGIDGVKRFLDRFYRLAANEETGVGHATDLELPAEVEKSLHKTIKKITEDIENMSFNTSISQMMIFVNDLYKFDCKSKKALLPLAQLLQPFAPHVAEEIWQALGGDGLVVNATWPTFNPALCVDDTVTMGVQVNGKMRGTIEITLTTDEKTAVTEALKISTVISALAGKQPTKVIYKAGKILNLIAPN